MAKKRIPILVIMAFVSFVYVSKVLAKPIDSTMGKAVMAHYQKTGDKQKLEAARFLLENMEYHSFKASPVLDKYYAGIEQINKKYKFPACAEQYNKLFAELGSPKQTVTIQKDENIITAEELISNIDMAFDDWRNGLWARHLSFDEFCEYLLPYRVENECLTKDWRENLRKRYKFRADGIKNSEDIKWSAYWAASTLNETLKRLGFNVFQVLPQLDVEMPLKALQNIRMGECHDYARFAVYVMRACGIPVALDYTPQWPDRAHGHYWNSLLDNSGKSIPFLGVESNPGYPCKTGQKMAKVYRKTFAVQKSSLYYQNQRISEPVPEILNSPFMKDVSEEYFVGGKISIMLKETRMKRHFVYLAVFDNQQWIPVDFSIVGADKAATFKNVGRNIIYMPVYWGRNGCIPAGNPFLLNYDGSIKTLNADFTKTQSVTFKRKYPLTHRVLGFRRLMKGGKFEAANKPDFSDAVVCANIKGVPLRGYDTLNTSTSNESYRYWRYVAPKNRQCNVSEIVYLNGNDPVQFKNVVCDVNKGNLESMKYAFDNNRLSFYDGGKEKGGWVGVDMGKPVEIEKILYIPRNDDNDVVCGRFYTLAYYEDGIEKKSKPQMAKSNQITFHGIPSGIVYVLHDITSGTEERLCLIDGDNCNWY